MDITDLKAIKREKTGNGPAKVLRREGRIPSVLYGPKSQPVNLSVATVDFEKILKDKGAQALINLVVEEGEGAKNVMIKELQQHPISGELIHLDFYEVSMDRKIKVNVPVTTTGKSKGVELGGMLQIIRRELEVYCYPNQIPEEIVIDIADMDIGDSFHVEDLELEGDVEIPAEVNFTVLTILSQVAEEEEEVEEEEELEEGEEAAVEEGEEAAPEE